MRHYPTEIRQCNYCLKDFPSTYRDRPGYGYCWRKYCSYSCRGKMASPKGENHYAWAGSKVSYKPLHEWVRKNYLKTDTCEKCGKRSNLESANVSGEYKRDRSDWLFLCKSCHSKMDGIFDHRNNKGQFVQFKKHNPYIPLPNSYLQKKAVSKRLKLLTSL